MTAREKFAVNDRVTLSEAGVENFKRLPARLGTVRGFGFEPDIVRVQVDGNRTVQPYHMKFWERIDAADEGAVVR